MKKVKKKKNPDIQKTDKEAEDFVDNADLTEYDLSGLVPVKFELRRKDKADKKSDADSPV